MRYERDCRDCMNWQKQENYRLKSAFWTFCFAFVPGAGQMHQGYMKRGLSLIGGCAFAVIMSSYLDEMWALIPVIWMYSFFDTFNLRGQLGAGETPEDDYLIHPSRLLENESLGRLLQKRNKLLGWVIALLGVEMLYKKFIRAVIWRFFANYDRLPAVVRTVMNAFDHLPGLFISAAVIALGVWLARGPRPQEDAPKRKDAEAGNAEDAEEAILPYFLEAASTAGTGDGTGERELIYRCVKESCEHPTAEMVYKQLKPTHPNLSMGTVYRNLNLLAEDGVLVRMPFTVERYDAITESHTHFRCSRCERVLDLEQPYDSALDQVVQESSGYQVVRHALIFEGICRDCLKSQAL